MLDKYDILILTSLSSEEVSPWNLHPYHSFTITLFERVQLYVCRCCNSTHTHTHTHTAEISNQPCRLTWTCRLCDRCLGSTSSRRWCTCCGGRSWRCYGTDTCTSISSTSRRVKTMSCLEQDGSIDFGTWTYTCRDVRSISKNRRSGKFHHEFSVSSR